MSMISFGLVSQPSNYRKKRKASSSKKTVPNTHHLPLMVVLYPTHPEDGAERHS